MKTKRAILLVLITVLAVGGSASCAESEQNTPAPVKENGIVRFYRAIENGVISVYTVIENSVVSGYKTIETGFINTFLTPKNDSVADGVTAVYIEDPFADASLATPNKLSEEQEVMP